MTIRDRIADWISGGKLTEAREHAHDLSDHIEDVGADYYEFYDALKRIAALETPGANATVRKMARIAREALGE